MRKDYRAQLGERTWLLKGKYGTEADLDWTSEQTELALTKSYENNCPLRARRPPKSAPWWNGHLERLRKQARKAFNKARKKRGPDY